MRALFAGMRPTGPIETFMVAFSIIVGAVAGLCLGIILGVALVVHTPLGG